MRFQLNSPVRTGQWTMSQPALFLGGLLILMMPAHFAFAADPPNIVFIYIDDLGYSDTGFMGAEHYGTPHIDTLARSGMVFTNAYAAAPNCAPSRACLMSGQYTPRHGIYTVNNSDRGKAKLRKLIPVQNTTVLPSEIVTLGEIFQSAGYQTGYFGKWHLGSPGATGPREQGFHVNVGGNASGSPRGGHFSPFRNPQLTDPTTPEYLTDRLSGEAVQFLRDHHEHRFFLFLSHYAVHTPIQAKPAVTRKYRDLEEEHGISAKYAAMIESVDDSVHAVVSELAALNLADNTMVVFYSDNGGYGKITSCAPLRGSKGMAYEGGIRVPLTIRWPGIIDEGRQCHVPVTGVDFYETFRVLLNVETPANQPLDGVNLIPLMTGETDTLNRKSLFWHFPAYLQGNNYRGAPDSHFRARPFGIVRQGNWKLIEFFEDSRLELYNLSDDLGETRNLAEQESERALDMANDLKAWRSEINAPVPTEVNPLYQEE